jgi:hypothetical protein
MPSSGDRKKLENILNCRPWSQTIYGIGGRFIVRGIYRKYANYRAQLLHLCWFDKDDLLPNRIFVGEFPVI